MFPLADDNPRELTPYVNWALIAVFFAVFLWQLTLTDQSEALVEFGAGLIPARLLSEAELPPQSDPVVRREKATGEDRGLVLAAMVVPFEIGP